MLKARKKIWVRKTWNILCSFAQVNLFWFLHWKTRQKYWLRNKLLWKVEDQIAISKNVTGQFFSFSFKFAFHAAGTVNGHNKVLPKHNFSKQSRAPTCCVLWKTLHLNDSCYVVNSVTQSTWMYTIHEIPLTWYPALSVSCEPPQGRDPEGGFSQTQVLTAIHDLKQQQTGTERLMDRM